jgi:hypothetical protein
MKAGDYYFEEAAKQVRRAGCHGPKARGRKSIVLMLLFLMGVCLNLAKGGINEKN